MTADEEKQTRRLRLRIVLEELRAMKGFGTELVTVYIPPGRQIFDVRQQLQNEHGQAANIKSKSTRKNVQAALESAISSLNRFKTAGDVGVVIFVGAIIVGNNKTRMVNITIDETPEKIQSFRYRCHSTFELDQLEDMLADKSCYGLFVIDRSEACFGLASGKRIIIKEYLPSQVPSKHGRGGQSAQRFERLIEEAAHNFYKKCGEHASNYWLPLIQDIQGIIVGGPGATKEYVVKGGYFHHEIQKKILPTMFDVGYSNESGLRELVANAGPLMGEIELEAEKRIVERFLVEIVQTYPKATYGEAMIRQALEKGAVGTLLISEDLRKRTMSLNCRSCNHEWNATLNLTDPLPNCSECGADDESVVETGSISIIDELSAMAQKSSGKVVLISTDSEEGATLYRGFGGLAALLRYSLG